MVNRRPPWRTDTIPGTAGHLLRKGKTMMYVNVSYHWHENDNPNFIIRTASHSGRQNYAVLELGDVTIFPDAATFEKSTKSSATFSRPRKTKRRRSMTPPFQGRPPNRRRRKCRFDSPLSVRAGVAHDVRGRLGKCDQSPAISVAGRGRLPARNVSRGNIAVTRQRPDLHVAEIYKTVRVM